MDLFDLLRGNLSPTKKMANAVLEKDVLLVEQILKSNFSVNSVIYEQGGQTALHLAVTSNNFSEDVVKKLIAYKASPSLENSFGETSIFKATVSNNNAEIVKFLLQHDESSTSMDSFWRSLQSNHSLICGRNLAVVLIATPDFTKYPEKTRKHSICLIFIMMKEITTKSDTFDFTTFYECLKLFSIFEKGLLSSLNNSHSSTDEGEKFITWFENHKKEVSSLQHSCRMVIRKAFDANVNVIYGVDQLALPNSLKQFLKFSDITDIGL